jgi:hypothetical protein
MVEKKPKTHGTYAKNTHKQGVTEPGLTPRSLKAKPWSI